MIVQKLTKNTDEEQRYLALNPRESFIVQAPAGSGKTELLTQRFLKLLGYVKKAPEEILAVTFTRKAASQMRQRICEALTKAITLTIPPDKKHEKLTYQLACEVVARDQRMGWNLLLNPNRLRIVTIDALSAYIVNRKPILSYLGGVPEIIENSEEYYRLAVDQLLTQTSHQEEWANDLKYILRHLDNRISLLTELLVDLLAKRDQWLPYLGQIRNQHNILDIEAYLNSCLMKIIEDHLKMLQTQFSDDQLKELMALLKASYAERHRENETLAALPGIQANHLPQWLGMVELLTTQQNTWRKAFNQAIGFPSPSTTKDPEQKIQRKLQKERMENLIDSFVDNEYLLRLLTETKLLPNHPLSSQQVNIINALSKLLPILVAHLHVIFQENGKVDFIEVALRALETLGEALEPSDIALALDYQLQHILIDEYQDTSVIQYRLFEKLVMGWQPQDGRTLFLVGDPMQSIYRFRGAEVSLFHFTEHHGLGQVSLTPLKLCVNFRSDEKIIQWVNEVFNGIFPSKGDVSLGAVSYSPGVAYHAHNQQPAIYFHLHTQQGAQSQKIARILLEILAEKPETTIAILVRAKKHLAEIIPVLKSLHIPFIAHEIEHLDNRMHVVDIISLLRALCHLDDKIAWYSVLRAPWLGLSLADLLALASHDSSGIIWENLQNFEEIASLSGDANIRLRMFVPIINYWLQNRSRQPLSQFVRGVWISLGGPACYENSNHCVRDIDKVFKLMDDLLLSDSIEDIERLRQRVSQLYADITPLANHSKQALVELMTIHKAKGLEFDTVIIPHLHAKTISHESSLLLWYERSHAQGIDLILAPRRSQGERHDPLYRYVENQIRKKATFEAARLLYVGVTRAKQSLHLLGNCDMQEQEIKPPSKGGFLSMLWPYIKNNAECQFDAKKADAYIEVRSLGIRQLPLQWQLPSPILERIRHNIQLVASDEKNTPQLTDKLAQSAGTVFHRMVQRWAHAVHELGELDELGLPGGCRETSHLALRRMGLTGAALAQGVDLIMSALTRMATCPHGQWILDPTHSDRHTEWPLSVKTALGVENVIIDYTFKDKAGIRWIVDYKLTHATILDATALQCHIEEYQGQIKNYQRILRLLEGGNVRGGLYFPLAKTWCEI